MAFASRYSEEQTVETRNRLRLMEYESRRKGSLLWFGTMLVASVMFIVTGHSIFSLAALFIAVIFLSMYFNANGQVHHVRERLKSRKSLTRDFSKLDGNGGTGAASLHDEPGPTAPGVRGDLKRNQN